MKTLLAVFFFTALASGAQPAQIILLRHAEKPDDPLATHLSPRGEERARALVSLLGRNSRLTSNAPIAALYAARVTRHGRSYRSGETLAPLADDLGLKVQEPYENEQYSLLAREIRGNRAYQGKTVVICWTHHNMDDLAAAFGVKPKPSAWKDKTFDRLWLLSPGAHGFELKDVPQHLLKGDSKH